MLHHRTTTGVHKTMLLPSNLATTSIGELLQTAQKAVLPKLVKLGQAKTEANLAALPLHTARAKAMRTTKIPRAALTTDRATAHRAAAHSATAAMAQAEVPDTQIQATQAVLHTEEDKMTLL